LWFPEPGQERSSNGGTLKLSDFGLATFNAQRTASMQPRSSLTATPEYRAPECDLEGGGAIGRSYDMWTLGCLYLEFITWLLGGWELVDEFNALRRSPDPKWYELPTATFFHVVRNSQSGKMEAEVKPTVTKVSREASPHPPRIRLSSISVSNLA
jgi:serine/threonine protein kinase